MPQFSVVCISLVIVTVLVQNASGKRGCAAFGHACYGGHGKRSSVSSPPGEGLLQYAGGNDRLETGVPVPFPYLKMALLDRSKSLDVAPELRPLGVENDAGGVRSGEDRFEQDRFDKGVRFAMHAFLRQLMAESRASATQRKQTEVDADSQLMNNEQQ
ncbi:uncharacterized protein LOC131437399 isoform X2 [Malaya genurostris]|nr:uncharacterized protein LOC131437399 isoform X2 [Malaya genurostris]